MWWDDVHEGDNPAPQKQMEGLSIPTLAAAAPPAQRQRSRPVRCGRPTRTLFEVNSTLQRLIALPPGAPRAAYDALSRAIERLNHDQEFAAEAMKVIQFVPEYPTAPDMSEPRPRHAGRHARDAQVHQRLYACRPEAVRVADRRRPLKLLVLAHKQSRECCW